MPSSPAELVPTSVPPGEVRDAAEEILSRPEYREPEPSVVERVLEAIGDFLGETIATLAGGGPGGVVATVVVAALVAAAVWFLVRSLRAGPGRSAAAQDELVQGTETPEGPDTWLAEADRLAAEGDHRHALRCRYLATVAALQRSGVVDDVPGRTPRELAAELGELAPEHGPEVRAVTEGFEHAWYGGSTVTPEEYRRFTSLAATVDGLGRTGGTRPRTVPA